MHFMQEKKIIRKEEGGVRISVCKVITTLNIRGTHTLDFSRKTTNAILSDLQIVDVIK